MLHHPIPALRLPVIVVRDVYSLAYPGVLGGLDDDSSADRQFPACSLPRTYKNKSSFPKVAKVFSTVLNIQYVGSQQPGTHCTLLAQHPQGPLHPYVYNSPFPSLHRDRHWYIRS